MQRRIKFQIICGKHFKTGHFSLKDVCAQAKTLTYSGKKLREIGNLFGLKKLQ